MSLSDATALTVPSKPLADDEVLGYTQYKRQLLVEELTRDGKLPVDLKDRAQLLAALDGMDRQTLTKAKIRVEEKAVDADVQARAILAHLISQTNGRSPYEIVVHPGEPAQRQLPRVDLSQLPAVVTVPGETDVGISDLTCDAFMETMTKDRALPYSGTDESDD